MLLVIPTLIGITIISFSIMHLAPGDPVDLFLGGLASGEGISTDRQSDTDKTREDLRRQLGLDKPIHIQYLTWLSNLVLWVEPFTQYERSALLVDKPLAELNPDEKSALALLEGNARKDLILEYFSRRHPYRILHLTRSSFWQ